MDFFDEEARPKFLFQSKFSSSQSPEPEFPRINKPAAFICVSISILISILTIIFLESETLRFILLWFSLAFIVGPFAPISITGGDILVGQGELLEEPDPDDIDPADELPKKHRRNKSRRPEEPPLDSIPKPENKKSVNRVENGLNEKDLVVEEKEWTEGDFDLLKKQTSKHPVGTPRRWEMIAEAFKGRHGVDSVIKMAKSMPERKPGGGDSFSQFLKQRKPLDKRMEEVEEEVKKENGGGEGTGWTSAEDIALLNALKAFPKDVHMRWDKIAVAVPGRSKTSCIKRVAELKKGFRSSKSTTE